MIAMSDFGIGNVRPTYPIKPVTPVPKDRQTGKRRKEKRPPDTDSDPDADERQPTIDEHV